MYSSLRIIPDQSMGRSRFSFAHARAHAQKTTSAHAHARAQIFVSSSAHAHARAQIFVNFSAHARARAQEVKEALKSALN